MPWLVGIDEAGYGPNLGPLVMTAVAVRVPEPLANADLWSVLAAAVRREGDRADDRPLIADSKVVHAGPHGLAGLEHGVLSCSPSPLVGEGWGGGFVPVTPHPSPPPQGGRELLLQEYLHRLFPEGLAELAREPWYRGDTALPSVICADQCSTAAERFQNCCRDAGLEHGFARGIIVCPARFNRIVDQWGSKGAVLADGLTDLVRWAWQLAGDDAVSLVVDKHGGRNAYAPMLQEAVPAGMIMAEREGMERSVYRLVGGPRPMRFTFQPRADGEHFLVALASMVSKYLRELLMGEFNRFWIEHVPGLKPTAGYPTDATRFMTAIRPKIAELGFSEQALWRCR